MLVVIDLLGGDDVLVTPSREDHEDAELSEKERRRKEVRPNVPEPAVVPVEI